MYIYCQKKPSRIVIQGHSRSCIWRLIIIIITVCWDIEAVIQHLRKPQTEKQSRGCISCIYIPDILSKSFRTNSQLKRQKLPSWTTAPWSPRNPITVYPIYLIFLENGIIVLHFAADIMGLSSFKFLWWPFGGLHNTFCFCNSAFQPFKVMQVHWYLYQSKPRMRLPITPS